MLPDDEGEDRRRRCWTGPGSLCGDLAAVDRRVSRVLHADVGRSIPRRGYLLLEYAGSGLLIPAVLLLALFARLSGPLQPLFVNMVVGFVTDLALVGSLKAAVRRPRPVYNKAGDYALIVAVDRHSFPSGHASRAVFIAALASAWGVPAAWGAAAWAWAAIVGLSRVLMGRHYLSDVAGGALVGFLNMVLVTGGTMGREGCVGQAEGLLWPNATTQLRGARLGARGLA